MPTLNPTPGTKNRKGIYPMKPARIRSVLRALSTFICTSVVGMFCHKEGSPQAAEHGIRYWGAMATETLSVKSGTILGGYGIYAPPFTGGSRRSQGTSDPLQVHATVLKGIRGNLLVLVGIDAVGLRSSTVDLITQELQRQHPGLQLLLGASHSHATPDTFGLWGELPHRSGVDVEYLQQIHVKTVQVVNRAILGLKPVHLTYAQENIPTLNKDVLTPNFATWIWMQDATTHQMMGSWTHWNAHPTTLPSQNLWVSADFVGAYRVYLRQHWGSGTHHGFMNGTLAGVYPNATTPQDPPFPVPAGAPLSWFQKTAGVGWDLFNASQRAWDQRKPVLDTSAFSRVFSVWVTISNPLFRLASQLGIINETPVQGKLLSKGQWFKLGDIQGVALPGEPSPLVSLEYERLLVANGASTPLVLGLTGGMLGYLLDEDREYGKKDWGYQTTVSPSPSASSEIWKRFKNILWKVEH